MKLSREEAWAGTLESMVDNRVVFYLRRYNRDYQDYSRQMKELCEKYPAIIQLIDGNNGVTLNDEEYQVFKTYSELSSNREMLERAYYYYFGQADMFHYQKLLKEISETKEREPEQRKKEILECMRQFRLEEAEKEFRFDTHLAASYAYCGDLAFTGCPYENLVNAGVIAYINHLFGMEEPPKGELSFSNANVTAVREGDIQKTPDITLNGDHRNKITIPVPQGVTGYNKSKGTNVSGGNLEVYGGDTFYLQAPLTVTGKWESGQLYGSVRESWKTLVLTSTGGNNQDIGAFISEKAAPVSFDIQWLNLARVKILKKDAETGNPLDGAVYGVYKNSTCTDQLLTIAMTGEDGISYSDYFDAALETVYVWLKI